MRVSDAQLERCGLEAPDASEVRTHAHELRGQLRGLWNGVLPVLTKLERRMPNWRYQQVLDTLRGRVT